MTRINSRLSTALALSLLIHAAPFLPAWLRSTPPSPPAPPPMRVKLPLLNRPASPPPLHLEQPKPPPAHAERPATPAPAAAQPSKRRAPWTQVVRDHLQALQRDGLFYPADAIAQNLEGEVLVLLILDEGGKVSAARVEQGSGHRLLDDAALRAVRSLSTLPADAPREVILPVRFRLR